MSDKKNFFMDAMVVGFALFAMFFGAGNIIFPPYIGIQSESQWGLAFFFYFMADVGLALVAIYAMLKSNSIDRVEAIMYRLGPIPARVMMAAAVICIGPLLAIPRTAAISFEMGVAPFLGELSKFHLFGEIYLTPALMFMSVIYFTVTFLFAIKESKVVDLVGRILTPVLVIGLLCMIIYGTINPLGPIGGEPRIDDVIWTGVSSGYQTLDVLAALVFALIVANALKAKGYTEGNGQFKAVMTASLVAGSLLLIIYGGLCYLGATASTMFPDISNIGKGEMVVKICTALFGTPGQAILSVVVLLACLTTSIGLTGAAGTFFSTLSKGKFSYNAVVIVVCIFSAFVSNLGLNTIISMAVPILVIVYPGALVVVILSLFNNQIKNDNIFRYATAAAVVVAVFEVIHGQIMDQETKSSVLDFITDLPWAEAGFAWTVPAAIFGVIGAFIPCKNPVK